MVAINAFTDFLIAIALGAVIGMEREIGQQKSYRKDFAGFRTFILITLLGALIGFIGKEVFRSDIFIIVGFISITLLIVASYTVTAILFKKVGATTEISGMLAFIIGLMTTTGLRTLAIVITVVITTLLVLKPMFHGFAKKIDTEEIYASIEFAIISLVVLPFLPSVRYTPMDIPIIADIIRAIPFISVETASQLNVFNPYKIWLMVVFITGMSFVGYILMKIFGAHKGIGLTGFLGGIVSSTAITTSLANESKIVKKVADAFILGTLVANGTMFIRVMIEVLVVNNKLIGELFMSIGLMALTAFLIALFYWNKERKEQEHEKKIDFKTPFALSPALKFSAFFALVLLIAKLFQILWGNSGIYIASLLSGIADVDAITLTMSNLAFRGDIANNVAVNAITIAVATNTVVKGFIAYLFGSKEFGLAIMKAFGIILLIGLGVGFFV